MRTITYDDGSRTEFEYDYMGRRVQIEEYDDTASLTERRTFLWDGLRIAQERIDRLNPIGDVGEEVTKTYFPQGEDHSGDSAAEYLYTRDHLGSVREVVDAADGSLAARYDYTPWGERTQTAGAVKADFAFTGHHYHEKSGLHLAVTRSYISDLGRWLSRDSLQEYGGVNLYCYTNSNPVNFIDIYGQQVVNPNDIMPPARPDVFVDRESCEAYCMTRFIAMIAAAHAVLTVVCSPISAPLSMRVSAPFDCPF